MNQIGEEDWSFKRIRDCCPARAARLESAGPAKDLAAGLVEALRSAPAPSDLRLAVDSKENKFKELRTIIQFRVKPELYDWFFNGRTGYRAQFWITPETGIEFNGLVVDAAKTVLRKKLPETVIVRQIEVHVNDGSRAEKDTGAISISRDNLLASLVPEVSKIWIGERLYDPDGGPIDQIGNETLRKAEQSSPKLCVPRWSNTGKPEGLLAPYPAPDCSWLDLKGGFLAADGTPHQFKPQEKRANDIYETGWT